MGRRNHGQSSPDLIASLTNPGKVQNVQFIPRVSRPEYTVARRALRAGLYTHQVCALCHMLFMHESPPNGFWCWGLLWCLRHPPLLPNQPLPHEAQVARDTLTPASHADLDADGSG